ncbi:hypothetical protein CCHR01_08140 [Colletotrichum chrysophilum]|uniref:Uncharacterized protein n=1 Tax=Colletotrichum chrysophilum TaxID=1836956 RepID=A0AAD9EJ05_9PEZI|nr:hypothetical protein CCHR01_08140 [Colletotrichum chrysophilum]
MLLTFHVSYPWNALSRQKTRCYRKEKKKIGNRKVPTWFNTVGYRNPSRSLRTRSVCVVCKGYGLSLQLRSHHLPSAFPPIYRSSPPESKEKTHIPRPW